MKLSYLKKLFYTICSVTLLMYSCTVNDDTAIEESLFQENAITTETSIENTLSKDIDSNLDTTTDENTTVQKKANTSNINRGTFLADPFGNKPDCSNYLFKRSTYSSGAFDVYYADYLTKEIIECIRKEYFEIYPELRLYSGVYLKKGIHHERWVIELRPTGGNPKRKVTEATETDSRVCLRTGGCK